MAVLVSSHNLREMEASAIARNSQRRKMMIERDFDELKTDIHKIQ